MSFRAERLREFRYDCTRVMRQVMEMSIPELLAMGERGQQLVQKKYTAPMIAMQMQQLYEWLLGERSKPDFVYD